MFKKIISVLLIAIILTLSLCACGDDDGIALVVPVSSDPLCLDPQVVETEEGKMIVANCYEGLVRIDENGKIVPGVAESWTVSSDGLTYTFKLRDNSKWMLLNSYKTVLPDKDYMDNFDSRVVAKDFEFGLQRAVNPATKCDGAEKLLCIKNARAIQNGTAAAESLGVNAVDDTKLVISLERANPDFLRVLTMPFAMPCNEEFFNATHAKYGLDVKYTFCNGPFYLSKWAEDNTFVIRSSESYKGEHKSSVSAVYFYVNKDEDSILTKFKQKSYCCAYLSNNTLSQLENSDKLSFITQERSVTGLCFNCADSVLANKNIRLALMSALKISDFSDKNMTAATGIIPGCCRFGEKAYRDVAGNVNPIAYNESSANELWINGMKEVAGETLNIKIICTEEYTAQMQKAIQSWQRIFGTSVVAKVETLTSKDFNTAIRNKGYQIAVGSVSTDSSTPVDILKSFSTGDKNNIFSFSDEAYDNLLTKIIQQSAGNGIVTDLRSAEQMLINQAIFCPLYFTTETLVVNEDTTGVFTAPAFENIIFYNGGEK